MSLLFESISSFDKVEEAPTSTSHIFTLDIARTKSRCFGCYAIVRTYKDGSIVSHNNPKTGLECGNTANTRSNILIECRICCNDYFQSMDGKCVTAHRNLSGDVCASFKSRIQISQGHTYYRIIWTTHQ